MTLPKQCPNCQADKEWFEEDEDGASAVCPSGFYCGSCYDIIDEIKPEASPEAKADCSLFAQPDEDFANHLEARKIELQATLSKADEKLARLKASMTDEQWQAHQETQIQKHINQFAELPEFWNR